MKIIIKLNTDESVELNAKSGFDIDLICKAINENGTIVLRDDNGSAFCGKATNISYVQAFEG